MGSTTSPPVSLAPFAFDWLAQSPGRASCPPSAMSPPRQQGLRARAHRTRQGKFADRARRNRALVHGLRAEGRGLREIARHLGWGLHTVQRYDRRRHLAGTRRRPLAGPAPEQA